MRIALVKDRAFSHTRFLKQTACVVCFWMSLYKEIKMKAIKNLFAKLITDEQGGEVLEYALIAGLIVVAAIAVITSVGTKVLARWTSLNSSM